MNNSPQSARATAADDDLSWFEVLGFGILLVFRWPFTPLWKNRAIDYDNNRYPLPKSDVPYRLLCASGAFVEIMLIVLPLSRWLDTTYAPTWAMWLAGSTFLTLTGIRIYMHGRNEAPGWTW